MVKHSHRLVRSSPLDQHRYSESDTGAALHLAFGADGKTAPAAFPTSPVDLPKDALCYIQFDKKK